MKSKSIKKKYDFDIHNISDQESLALFTGRAKIKISETEIGVANIRKGCGVVNVINGPTKNSNVEKTIANYRIKNGMLNGTSTISNAKYKPGRFPVWEKYFLKYKNNQQISPKIEIGTDGYRTIEHYNKDNENLISIIDEDDRCNKIAKHNYIDKDGTLSFNKKDRKYVSDDDKLYVVIYTTDDENMPINMQGLTCKKNLIFTDIGHSKPSLGKEKCNKNQSFTKGNTNIRKHIKIYLDSHGDDDRVLSYTLQQKHFNYSTAKTKSYYISSGACNGGFYDKKGNNIFDIVKEQIKEKDCIGFVSLLKSNSILLPNYSQVYNHDKGKYYYGVKRESSVPIGKTQAYIGGKFNKNDYVDYYVIMNIKNKDESISQKIFQIPAELCYWRERLIDNNQFIKAFQALQNGQKYNFRARVYSGLSINRTKTKTITLTTNKRKIKECRIVDMGFKNQEGNSIYKIQPMLSEEQIKKYTNKLKARIHKYNKKKIKKTKNQ